MKKFSFWFCCLISAGLWCQNEIVVNAQLLEELGTIRIQQDISYTNTSKDTLSEIYLTDWANSFSSKTTPLADRFAENYDKKFHLAKDEDRGKTTIRSISNKSGEFLQYNRPEGHPDILRIPLQETVLPGETYQLRLLYKVKLPNARFTRYGITRVKDYNLRYWFITPAVYDGEWQYYSNKNLHDRYFPKSDILINFSIPKGYNLISDLDITIEDTSYKQGQKIARLSGKDRVNSLVFLRQNTSYEAIETDYVTLLTNISDNQVPPQVRALLSDRIAGFLTKNIGKYPHKKLLLTDIDYKEDPVYGLNQLPDFIRPFPDGFQYEVKILKTAVNKFVDNTLLLNPREERWLSDGIKVYLVSKYMDEVYPDLKVIGNLSKYWLVRQFYASELEFNDQVNMLYTHMARLNLDQSLTTPRDSLIKFNLNIANAYKSGAGLNYIGDYIGKENLDKALIDFYNTYKLKTVNTEDFKSLLTSTTDKNLDWFFEDFLKTRKKIDFTFKKGIIKGDSVVLTIKNKRDNNMPVSVFGIKNDTVVSKTWVSDIGNGKDIAFAKAHADRYVLNHDKIIPEFNLRDNYKTPGSFLGFDKPLQFKLFQDFENPEKSQVFFMPTFEFNIYDGFSPGLKMYNKTILTKRLNYKIEPQFGLRSKSLIGSASISYTHNIDKLGGLNAVRYGISGNTFSYAPDLFYKRISPFLTLSFRTDDLRSDKSERLLARYVSVRRDEDINNLSQEPNYSVFNLRYSNRNPGIVDTFNWNTDFQLGKDFSKLSATFFYRKLFLNNRQLNVRLFGGTFVFNDTENSGDFFSFALDRPTDYLFDYNYYGRSEDSGLFSQQLILAEGGFKSQLEPAFANKWIATANASTTIWKYIYAYGDIGFVKNKNQNAAFVYDSGIHVSLLDDYFELYFPVYSNNGWEIAQPNYDQKIRFVVTIGLNTAIRLFSRRWY